MKSILNWALSLFKEDKVYGAWWQRRGFKNFYRSTEAVTNFEYLGVTLTVDGGSDDEEFLMTIKRGKVVT